MDYYSNLIQDRLAAAGWTVEAFFALLLAAIAGGLIGLEREIRGREAGFRTNLLVCFGSTLVMLVSRRFALIDWPPIANANINIDPARIAYGVMTGIGFLGAGAIIKHGLSIRGLTTAASLWCVAAVGLAIGFGMYLISFYATGLVLIALWLLDRLENILPRRQYRRIIIRCRWEEGCVPRLLRKVRESGLEVIDRGFSRHTNILEADVHLVVTFGRSARYYEMESRLAADPTYQIIASEAI